MKMKKDGNLLAVYLDGEIDHCSAEKIRNEMEKRLLDQSITRLALDFSDVSFMDSSGVGMIIGRYKTMTERSGTVSACGMHPPVRRVFRMAGLHRIIAEEAAEDGNENEE